MSQLTINGTHWDNGHGYTDAETCTACSGTGTVIIGDWSKAYPERTCRLCEGSGLMRRARGR
jgi:DnaJ-class molecular chaperone